VTNRGHVLLEEVGMPDADLIVRARAGDRGAQNALVDRYYDDCWRYAARLLGNRTDAEDVVQETFMRAMAALPQYQDQERFRGWLFTILVNQCRNFAVSRQRRARRFLPLGDDGAMSTHLAVAPDPLPNDALHLALTRLDPLQREALLLKFGEGMSYADMVRVTGATESALKMRVKRGCERLRTYLDPSDA